MGILPIKLSLDNIAAYQAHLAAPGAVYADPKRCDAYLKMFGYICYETCDEYVNFPWPSER